MRPYIVVNKLNIPSIRGSEFTFTVSKGEIIGLTGENASGKSMLAGYLTGMYRPVEIGQVIVNNLDPFSMLDREKLCQLSALVPQYPLAGTVYDNVGRDVVFGMENMGLDEQDISYKASRYFKKLDLKGCQKRGYNSLSGSEKQRAILAAVICMEKDFMVIDESFSMLGREDTAHYIESIISIARIKKQTVIIISKRKDILDKTDRVLTLKNGRVHEGSINVKDGDRYFGDKSKSKKLKIKKLITGGEKDSVSQILEDIHSEGEESKESLDIILDDVTIGYHKEAIDKVSYTFSPEFTYHISGAVNSGKTALCKTITGIIKPVSGNVSMSEDVVVGYVAQFPEDHFLGDTVLDEVMYGPLSFGHTKSKARQMAQETMQFVGLPKTLWDKSPMLISAGEQRMVSVAAGLALNPDYLILDEPFVSLDKKNEEKLRLILTELTKYGKGIIIAEAL